LLITETTKKAGIPGGYPNTFEFCGNNHSLMNGNEDVNG